MLVYVYQIDGKRMLYIKDISSFVNISSIPEECILVDGLNDIDFEKLNELGKYNTEIQEIIKNYDALFNNVNRKKRETSIIGGEFVICLHPSSRCNLNCKYCFRGEDYVSKCKLTFETAKKAIDYTVYNYAKHASKYVIDLSGSGEPLLEIELVKQIVDYCNSIQDQTGKSVAVMFVTNGTVNISEEDAKYLSENVILGISLDGGKAVNDNMRVTSDNRGTYDKVNKFKNKIGKKIGIATTITPLCQKVDQIYDELAQLDNVDCIGMKLVRRFDKSDMDVNNFLVEKLIGGYKRICSNIYYNLDNNNLEYLLKLLRGNDFFGNFIVKSIYNNVKENYRCNAGIRRISVDKDGKIYPCSVLNGIKQFNIGSIEEGIDEDKQNYFRKTSAERFDKCKKCWALGMCGGECQAVNFFKGDKDCNDILCSIKKELIKLSMVFVDTMKEQYAEEFRIVVNFVLEKETYKKTNVGVWAILKYLKAHNFSETFKEICDNVVKSNYGVELKEIVNYLKKSNKDVKVYEINDSILFKELKYPCLAVLNKYNRFAYDYVYIKEILDEDLIYENLLGENIRISQKQFIDQFSNIVII